MPLLFALQPQRIQGAMAGHGEEPGAQWTARGIVAVRVFPELQKNILEHLLGVRGLLQNSKDERVDLAAISVVERFESGRISVDEPLHQGGVVRLLGHGFKLYAREKHGG
jgi:hypothetical protein